MSDIQFQDCRLYILVQYTAKEFSPYRPTGRVILSNEQGCGGGVGTDQLGNEVGEGQVQVGQVSLVRLQSKQVILQQVESGNI